MIRKFTTSFIVLAALVSISMAAEPQSLLPAQPQLPPSPRYLPVSRATPQARPVFMPVSPSTHERMLSIEDGSTCQTVHEDGPGQPLPLATWWSNTCAGQLVHEVARDTCKANRWPEPFVQYDNESEKLPFITMIEKGWKRQNTLGDVHFDPNTGELNMSGRLKVRHILFEGLRSRRDLFVYRGETKQDTEARLGSVEAFVHRMIGNDPDLPQVSVTDRSIPGCSAQYVDVITRKYNETIPDPRIPQENEANFTEN